jgi:uncharacterized protein YpmB
MKNKKILVIIILTILLLIIGGYFIFNKINSNKKIETKETPTIISLSSDVVKSSNIHFTVDEDKYPHIKGNINNISNSIIYIDNIIVKTIDSNGNIIDTKSSDIKQEVSIGNSVSFDVNMPLNNGTVKCDVYGYIK